MKRSSNAAAKHSFLFATILVVFIYLVGSVGFAADITIPASAPASPYFPAGETSVIVPFDSYSNLILVQAQVNGAGPLTFALDTAFPTSLIDKDAATALKLPIMHGATPVPGQVQFVTFTAKIDDLTIPGEEAKVVSLATLPGLLGIKIDGILGEDIFHHFGITINYQTRAITFTANGTLTQPDGSDALPITESPKGLIVPVILTPQKGDPLEAYAKIDTGSTDALGLTGAYVQSSTVLVPKQQEILVPAGFGETSPDEKVFVTRLGAIQLGPYTFKAPVTTHSNDIAPQPYNAVIGGEILRRFTISFDLLRSRLYLTPNSSIHQPFLYDGSGLTLAASGPTLHVYTVTAVRPFSPASDADVQVGDVLTGIDGNSSDTLTLADVRGMLSQVGEVYHATFVRAGKTRTATLAIKWRV